MRAATRRNESVDVGLSIVIPAGSMAAAGGDYADSLAGGQDFWQVAGLAAVDTLNVRTGPSPQERVRDRQANGKYLREAP
jgi:hypothetical protein